jgi:hypothetical protein
VTAVLYVEDVLLVDRCLTGEPAATRELFRRHRNRVHASLFRVLGSNQDMDDLLQEAFLQVFQSLRGWRARPATEGPRRGALCVPLSVAAGAPCRDRSARRGRGDRAELTGGAGRAVPAGARRRGVLYAVFRRAVAGGAAGVHAAQADGRSLAETAELVGSSGGDPLRVGARKRDQASASRRSGAEPVPRACRPAVALDDARTVKLAGGSRSSRSTSSG